MNLCLETKFVVDFASFAGSTRFLASVLYRSVQLECKRLQSADEIKSTRLHEENLKPETLQWKLETFKWIHVPKPFNRLKRCNLYLSD